MRHLVMLAAEGGGEAGIWNAIKENPTFLMLNLVVSAIVLTVIVERAAFSESTSTVAEHLFSGQVITR